MIEPVTIVHMITRFIKGGADENTLLTCNGQAERGYSVHLVIGCEYDAAMLAKLAPSVTVHIVKQLVRPVSPANDIACVAVLFKLLRKLKPDIVHTHESKAGIVGRLSAVMAGVHAIVHGVHILPFVGVTNKWGDVFLLLEKVAAHYTNAFVDVSEGMRDICLAHGLGTAENHFVVPSGMDLARYRKAQHIADWRKQLPQLASHRFWNDKNPKIALISGTLEARKRVFNLVQALKNAPSESEWLLVIAGDGAQKAEIEQYVTSHGIGHRVALLGHCDSLENYIHLADVCVHAATNEGLPRVVVQYVLAGRPVVATHLPGIERVVQDGLNGDLVSLNDIDLLARRLVLLLNDTNRQAAYQAHARRIDLSQWDTAAMIDGIDRAYDHVRVTSMRVALAAS